MIAAIAAPLVTLVSTPVALILLLRLGKRQWLLDRPNYRSLHAHPVPRLGGIAVVFGLVAGFSLIFCWGSVPDSIIWFLGGASAIVLVSFADDLWSLSAALRLGVHVTAAVIAVMAGLSITHLPLPGGSITLGVVGGGVFSVLFFVWFLNLYNFMDGMDGLVGGMTGFGFGGLGLLCWMADAYLLAVLCATVVASMPGFLWFNFPPARVFMGDTGAPALGYLAAGFSILAQRIDAVPLWVSGILFSPFIVDATLTFARRVWRLEPVWSAHRSHYYQRLVGAGYSHRQVVLGEYGLMLACVLLALLVAMSEQPVTQWLTLGSLAAGYILLIRLVHRLERAATP